MPIGRILASVTGGARDAAILRHAIEAARPFNAHVSVFFVRPDLSEAITFFNDGVSGAVVDEVLRASRDAADEAAKRILDTITEVCREVGVDMVPAPQRADAVTVSLRQTEGDFGDQLTEAARLSDIIVFGPVRHGDKVGLADAFVQVLVQTDRPVLLSTEVAPSVFARHVAIGWDGKTAASQAVSAAIPYLARAEKVEILSVQRAPGQGQSTEALTEYLALHGVGSSVRAVAPGSRSIGEVLLEAATSSGADLLVVGGYGHSRLRESLIGGITRHVITHAKLAVFMVH